jgi:transcriptional regulator with XRE-family HTH domain
MSSPLAKLLKKSRVDRGLRQHDVARTLGYEQAYLSAIELGTKSPSQEFLLRFANAFQFEKQEMQELEEAVRGSRRRFVLPYQVPTETYQLCNELWEKIDRLVPAQVIAIRHILRIVDEIDQLALRASNRPGLTQNSEGQKM